jgi:hypothetical protein
MFYDPVGPWHRWFAWRPVDTITHGWKWLRMVERRRIQSKLHLPGPIDQGWQYRTPGGAQ